MHANKSRTWVAIVVLHRSRHFRLPCRDEAAEPF